jgi:phage baseplate assembly protein W
MTPDSKRAFLGVGWTYPVCVDAGRTGTAAYDEDIRQAIRIIMGTNPGERVMRPDFGSGLLGLVFEPGGPELVATTQHLVQGSLQQELGHLIAVESVQVSQDEGVFSVDVRYVALRTQEQATASFTRSAP